ncbi:MAG TPA: hypothetical protein VNN09_08985 [Candidatus Competibacteraceae bacterium]|nr:hypothetical protein [Candidatus Competibacteraceae bacterium]
MLGTIEVHAGDFVKGNHGQFVGGEFLLKVPGKFLREKTPAAAVEEIEVATEASAKKFAGTVGWGVAGGLLLGLVGLLAGLLAGGRKKMVIFVCKFQDGRKFLGSTNLKTWAAIMAARF